jgi:hypothetical protein
MGKRSLERQARAAARDAGQTTLRTLDLIWRCAVIRRDEKALSLCQSATHEVERFLDELDSMLLRDVVPALDRLISGPVAEARATIADPPFQADTVLDFLRSQRQA